MAYYDVDDKNYDYSKTEGYNEAEHRIERIITLKVNPINPDYTIPVILDAVYGQVLGNISLPNGFTWQDDENKSVGNPGKVEFLATYTP